MPKRTRLFCRKVIKSPNCTSTEKYYSLEISKLFYKELSWNNSQNLHMKKNNSSTGMQEGLICRPTMVSSDNSVVF